jgi:hypothetical protein
MRLLFTPLILATLVMATLTTPSWAHRCILGGSSATDIQIYNSCKADLAVGNAGHQDAGTDLSDEMSRLQAENDALKARLTAVKRQLLNLLGDL